jgi:hypothetical protein
MKFLRYSSMILLAAITAPAYSETTNAVEAAETVGIAESAETSDDSHTYVGVKAGGMIIGHGIPWNDDGVMMSVLFGYDVPDSGWAFEGEFSTTVSKPTSDEPGYGDLGVTTLGGYGVYRSSGRLYFKAKIGLLYEYLTSSVTSSGGGITIDVDGPGLSIPIGIGGGVHVNDRLSAEVEYTMIEADIGYYSFGLNWML